jgi:hypothetical protein
LYTGFLLCIAVQWTQGLVAFEHDEESKAEFLKDVLHLVVFWLEVGLSGWLTMRMKEASCWVRNSILNAKRGYYCKEYMRYFVSRMETVDGEYDRLTTFFTGVLCML